MYARHAGRRASQEPSGTSLSRISLISLVLSRRPDNSRAVKRLKQPPSASRFTVVVSSCRSRPSFNMLPRRHGQALLLTRFLAGLDTRHT